LKKKAERLKRIENNPKPKKGDGSMFVKAQNKKPKTFHNEKKAGFQKKKIIEGEYAGIRTQNKGL